MTWDRFWPTACSLWAVLAFVMVAIDVGGPARMAVVLSFLLLCPGMAYVGFLGMGSHFLQLVTGIALSLLLGVVVGQALVYTSWRPVLGLAALCAITFLGAALPRPRPRTPPPSTTVAR
jgi:hypothetical protein